MIKKFNSGGNNILLWLCIVVFLAAIYSLFLDHSSRNETIPFSDFVTQVSNNSIQSVTIRGNIVTGQNQSGQRFESMVPIFYPKLLDTLLEHGVKVDIQPTDTPLGNVVSILLQWFPVLLLAGVWIYFMRNVQSGGKAMGFGRSKARLVENSATSTFADVAGADEAKEELQEIVEFLKDPAKFQRLGGRIPKGCLLVGPPGTGKTLLARAVAGEAGVPFFSISGSDFVEMFVGVGASRVRDMFTHAKKSCPCIVFIDEIDAVGRHRGVGLGGGNDEREQTLNQLLVEMDGFDPNNGVIVIAATNRPDVLDPALLRPGRFDRQVVVPVPDVNGRKQIIGVHLKKVPIGPDVDINILARGTPGFVGADLANLVNEAALWAARLNLNFITMEILEKAKDKVLMGSERRSILMSEEERRVTAYHEGGHALISVCMPDSDPLHKVTIIPRGKALGVTIRLAEGDRYSESRAKLCADLVVIMGGRVAEELIFGHDKVTTGASSDIKMATTLARKMVAKYGLSDRIGFRYIDVDSGDYFDKGRGMGERVSEHLLREVDEEVKRILEDSYKHAHAILEGNLDKLEAIARALLEYETLTAEEARAVIDGKGIREKSGNRAGTTDGM